MATPLIISNNENNFLGCDINCIKDSLNIYGNVDPKDIVVVSTCFFIQNNITNKTFSYITNLIQKYRNF